MISKSWEHTREEVLSNGWKIYKEKEHEGSENRAKNEEEESGNEGSEKDDFMQNANQEIDEFEEDLNDGDGNSE